jgi:tyrosine-protein phosphatase YwqE
MSNGYRPVLAHPERYAYMNDEDYKQLKDMGVLFQLNFVSLTGLYGSSVRKRAEHLLKVSCYDLMGSDIHSFVTHSQQLKIGLHENVIKLMNCSNINKL